MDLGIITPNDLVKNLPFGGTSGYVQNILKDIPMNVKIFGAGVNGTQLWKSVKITQNAEFIPVFRMTYPSAIPQRLKAFYGYIAAKNKILNYGVDILYIHSPESVIPFLYGKSIKPIVYHQHGSSNPITISKYKWARHNKLQISRIFNSIHEIIYKRADWIIAIDRICRQQAINAGAEMKTSLVMNAVNTDKFHYAETARTNLRIFHQTPVGCCVLLFVGRLEEVKNIPNLIEAVKELSKEGRSYQLYIVGDGSLRNRLDEMIEAENLTTTVHLLGKINHDEMVAYYNMADIFVLPSKMEGVPMVILEALACGTPVLATNVGGIPDLITAGKNGFLIKSYTSNDIASGIKTLQDLNINRNAIAMTVSHLSSKLLSNQLRDLFNYLVDKKCH